MTPAEASADAAPSDGAKQGGADEKKDAQTREAPAPQQEAKPQKEGGGSPQPAPKGQQQPGGGQSGRQPMIKFPRRRTDSGERISALPRDEQKQWKEQVSWLQCTQHQIKQCLQVKCPVSCNAATGSVGTTLALSSSSV